MLFGLEEPSLSVTVLLHAGTLLATLIMLRKRVLQMLAEVPLALRDPSRLRNTDGGRDLAFVVIASIPTGVIGLALRDAVERWTASPLVVAIGFFLTAGVLISSRWALPGDNSHPSLGAALIVGFVQGLAVLPGLSRSGSTITAALWLGVRADRAFELSMLLSLPAVTAAVGLEALKAFDGKQPLGLLLLGAGVAFGVGLLALWWLRHTVARGYLSWFALWVLPVACATLALAWAWPVRV
jgi:undecaprenyl-diphosphatase